ncbi:MAG: hypothetical protein L6R42_009348 [Xanthoria sp. 1 TBL-2021]|nr:MAG: hypothetical protein L6R42_009348 [Xanthoria sp. 1 TBL-2021]
MQIPKFGFHTILVLIVSSQHFRIGSSAPLQHPKKVCRKAECGLCVFFLPSRYLFLTPTFNRSGAGVAGITTAQALSNASLTDFVILEYLPRVGGRVSNTNFGRKADGTPYVVELGANWVQGLVTPPGPENPIWTLLITERSYSDYDSIATFNETGAVDFTGLLDEYENAYATFEQDAGYILTDNLQDRTARAGLSLAGWKPEKDAAAQAVEWWQFDFEYSVPPEQSSHEFTAINNNSTFYQWSNENNFVHDERGFNTFIKGEAATFLKDQDPRLLLNTVVANISYDGSGVTIDNEDGSCVQADYAVCTFSVGVLQSDAITFKPELPSWKQTGIETFIMGTYTKIFIQFPPDQVFWNTSYQYLLYADPTERGYYPVFQSLDGEGFFPGSGIIFVTVVQSQSYVVESQDDQITKDQVLAVLRNMFGAENVPEPIAFMYPRWSLEPWAYGSYSNWPPGTTLEMHQNLRANVDRLYFAGEATSAQYFGFLHGAWVEGKNVGEKIAGLIKGTIQTEEVHYDPLHGTTFVDEYDSTNGFILESTFATYGFK